MNRRSFLNTATTTLLIAGTSAKALLTAAPEVVVIPPLSGYGVDYTSLQLYLWDTQKEKLKQVSSYAFLDDRIWYQNCKVENCRIVGMVEQCNVMHIVDSNDKHRLFIIGDDEQKIRRLLGRWWPVCNDCDCGLTAFRKRKLS